MIDRDAVDLRVLICAPIGRDAELTVDLLARAAIASQICRTASEVADLLQDGAGAILLTQEALADPRLNELSAALEAQPAWSDISVLLFAGDDRSAASMRTLQTLEVLRNVTLLDRPVGAAAVVSTVRAALRGRRRQYELRDVLVALHRARSDAEQANRLKDEFLATLSHELRTPLNAILGWTSILRDGRVEADRTAKILDIIERNAKAQRHLISDVLDVSRMVTGRIRLKLQPTIVGEVVRDAIDTVRPAAESKGVELHVDVGAGPILVLADRERLQQVFWNLLSNAVKFTPAGGRVDVTASRSDGMLTFVVSDTGDGLSPEFLPFAFDRFRQADQSFTRAHGGLGLGLAIVKHLVEMHGGHVTAASDGVGRGATFTVSMPAAAAIGDALLDGDGSAAAAERTQWRRADFSGRRILVVDDDATTRELLETMLADCGAKVDTAESAVAALQQFETAVPSLLVADIGMPNEDGLSLIRRIRERTHDAGGAVPAVALSAYARAEDRVAAIGAGFNDYIAKPATPDDIIAAVEKWLSSPAP
jgi:signal transduction histidine kinase/CheY-like chemotaxis protein